MEINPLHRLSTPELRELLAVKKEMYHDAIQSGKIFYDTRKILSEIRALERQLKSRNEKTS